MGKSEKIKILYVESGTSGGGSFESLYQYLRAVNRQSFHPVVVYLNNNHYTELVKSLGITVYVLTDWFYSKQSPSYTYRVLHKMTAIIESYMPRCYLPFLQLAHIPMLISLKHIISKEIIDIIHLNVQINRDLIGLFVAERTNVPCISHLRSMRSGGFDRFRAVYANRVVSTFIANSNSTKEHWIKLGIDEKKINVVYNAINKAEIKPVDIRKNWGIDKTVGFIVGCVGSLASGKGHGFLLQTFARFVKRRPDVILLLAGDGIYREELVKQAIELGIHDRVIFTGYIRNVQGVIASLDLLILPSETESFGRVLLEAMQAGTPIVATNVGGIPEVVEHEYNGLLVSYGDEERLQEAMGRLLTDDDLRFRLIKNGRQTVDRFSMENYTANLESIYRTVIKK